MPTARLKYLTQNQVQGVVNKITSAKRARLKQVGGSNKEIVFPYGPQQVKYDRSELFYKELRRPSRKPILIAESPQLRTVTFTALLADRQSSGKQPIETLLEDLDIMASEAVDCEFTYGLISLPFRVRITKKTTTTIRRDVDGNIIQASVDIQLTEIVEPEQVLVTMQAVTATPEPDPTPTTTRTTAQTTPPEPVTPPSGFDCALSKPTCPDGGGWGWGVGSEIPGWTTQIL